MRKNTTVANRLRRVRFRHKKNRGPESLDVSTTLNRLGLCQRDLNKFAEAEKSLKRALAIREKRLAPNHAWIAISLQNLASVYTAQHQDEKADPLLARSQAIYSKIATPR
jgi:Tfp pilus assembly protein PilF